MSNENFSILIAEDDPSILQLARVVLTKEGYCVQTCTNGEEAIMEIKVKDFNLVIVDESMPKAKGNVVAHFIREHERTRHIPIIMITAENNPTHFNELLKTGLINLFLPKPFSPKLFLNMINFLIKTAPASSI
jgi:two-component system phosphate regulon response regulator PhoB